MKIEWQESDILGGRMVAKPGRSERWMIGYLAAFPGKVTLVSLTDGMILAGVTPIELAAKLNESGDYPAEFVDATKPNCNS